MKKQIHILEGIMIHTIIIIFGLFAVSFIYKISHEELDSSYMWDISFSNLKVKDGSKEGTISLENDAIALEVELEEENEYYEFTLDVENKGTLDAKISDINLNVENDKNILEYSLTYLDDRYIEKDDILKSGEKKTIKVKIYYPTQSNKVYDALNLKLSFDLNYTAVI